MFKIFSSSSALTAVITLSFLSMAHAQGNQTQALPISLSQQDPLATTAMQKSRPLNASQDLQAPDDKAKIDPSPTSIPLKEGLYAFKNNEKSKALDIFTVHAKKGNALAMWKLANMYAKGDGIDQNDRKAFGYYHLLADRFADMHPSMPHADMIAQCFVALGHYYRTGIEGYIQPHHNYALELFHYAATYFGNSEAQYHLGLAYLDDENNTQYFKAARWLKAASLKGHRPAQLMLGEVLLKGTHFRKKRKEEGLKWIAIAARDHQLDLDIDPALKEPAKHDIYQQAFKQYFMPIEDDAKTRILSSAQKWLDARPQ